MFGIARSPDHAHIISRLQKHFRRHLVAGHETTDKNKMRLILKLLSPLVVVFHGRANPIA